MSQDNPDLWYLKLPHQHIVDLICIIEGYEGLAVPRVLDKQMGVVELLTAPDLHHELEAVLEDMKRLFPVERIERPPGIDSIADDEIPEP